MKFVTLCIFAVFILTTGCAIQPKTGVPAASPSEVAALADSIHSLGPKVDPQEAKTAAKAAFEHAQHLSVLYQVTDAPLIHNTKVNLGLRNRGLCWHWALDMETRLKQTDLKTLDLHMARSKPQSFRIGHSTLIISAKGDKHTDGIILDPWRYGGKVFWRATKADKKYIWLLESEVLKAQATKSAPLS